MRPLSLQRAAVVLRLWLSLAVVFSQFPAVAFAALTEGVEPAPAAAWGDFLGGLSAAQTQVLSQQLQVVWSPSVQAAIVHVMAGARALPARDGGQGPLAAVAPQIKGAIARSAVLKAKQVEGIAKGAGVEDAAALKRDLKAIEQLKGALGDERIVFDRTMATYRSEKVQALIAAARTWNDRSAPEFDDAVGGGPGNLRVTLGRSDPAARRIDADQAFGARAPPALRDPARVAPGLAERLQGILATGRQVLDGLKNAAPATETPGASVAIGDLVSVLRAINNLPDEEARSYRARYPEWFSDVRIMAKAVGELKAKESLTPARMDTVIFNQAAEKDDAIVELVNNGADTSLEKAGLRALVGRFGVGAFQALQELGRAGDRVTLETATKPGRVLRLTFSIDETADPNKIGEQIKIHFESFSDASFGTGTLVRVVKAGGLSAARQASLKAKLAAKMSQSARVPVTVNGQTINSLADWTEIDGSKPAHAIADRVGVKISGDGYEVRDQGLGMSEATVLEKFLLPRRSTKAGKVQKVDETAARAQTRLLYRGERNGSDGKLNKMKVTLGVSGVAVESFEVEGLRLPEEVFLDLLPGSWLPESRNKIAVTPEVWSGLKGLMEQVLSGDLEKNLGLLNALAAIGGYLENPRTHPEASQTGESFARFMSERLDRVPGLKKLPEFRGEGGRAYAMSLKAKDQVYLKYGPNLIFDQQLYDRYKDYPLLLNLALNFRIGYGDQKPSKGEFPLPEIGEKTAATPALGATDALVEEALSKTSWYAAVKEINPRGLRSHLAALLAKLPENERPAALKAEISNLGVYAQFAREHAPSVDWTRWLTSVSNSPVVDQTFDDLSALTTIGGKIAFTARKNGILSVYIDGKEVWSRKGWWRDTKLVDLGGGWALMPHYGEVYHLIVNGEDAWSASRFAGGLTVVDGKPAFYVEGQSPERIEVYVGGKSVSRFDGFNRSNVRELVAVGNEWAIMLEKGDHRTVSLGGRAIWSGLHSEIKTAYGMSSFIDQNGKLVSRGESRGWLVACVYRRQTDGAGLCGDIRDRALWAERSASCPGRSTGISRCASARISPGSPMKTGRIPRG